MRQVSERTVPVNPYFRLAGRDAAHRERCPYDTRGQVIVIVRGSDPDVISSLDAGSERKFRLNILRENPARLADESVRISKRAGGGGKTLPPQKLYVRSVKLTPYLRSVSQIMKLRARIEGNDEVAKLIELNFQGKKLRWADFYYEDETEYGKCFDYLERLWARPGLVHPVCIQGRVKQVDPRTEKFTNYSLRLYSPFIKPDEDGIKRFPSVRIALGGEACDLAERISPDMTIVAHAIWRVSRSDVRQLGGQKVRFHDIRCTAFNAQQVYVEG
jgi:hypothetical protein